MDDRRSPKSAWFQECS